MEIFKWEEGSCMGRLKYCSESSLNRYQKFCWHEFKPLNIEFLEHLTSFDILLCWQNILHNSEYWKLFYMLYNIPLCINCCWQLVIKTFTVLDLTELIIQLEKDMNQIITWINIQLQVLPKRSTWYNNKRCNLIQGMGKSSQRKWKLS